MFVNVYKIEYNFEKIWTQAWVPYPLLLELNTVHVKMWHSVDCFISGAGGGVKASTVLTNLQRGNIPTIMQTVVEPVVVAGPHQRAGQGKH